MPGRGFKRFAPLAFPVKPTTPPYEIPVLGPYTRRKIQTLDYPFSVRQVLYCSGVWSYVVASIATPTFILVPLGTIWIGIFPIVLSWWAALGLTVYYIATTLVRHLPSSSPPLPQVPGFRLCGSDGVSEETHEISKAFCRNRSLWPSAPFFPPHLSVFPRGLLLWRCMPVLVHLLRWQSGDQGCESLAVGFLLLSGLEGDSLPPYEPPPKRKRDG